MREFNHWSEQIKEEKRKDKLDTAIFFLLIFAGVLVTWII